MSHAINPKLLEFNVSTQQKVDVFQQNRIQFKSVFSFDAINSNHHQPSTRVSLWHSPIDSRTATNTDLHDQRNPILLLPEGEGRDEGEGGVVQPDPHRSHENLLDIQTCCLPMPEIWTTDFLAPVSRAERVNQQR